MEECQADNRKLRNILFSIHGSKDHYLYGDDGERCCNSCGIDFMRHSAVQIEKMLNDNAMKVWAKVQEDCSHTTPLLANHTQSKEYQFYYCKDCHAVLDPDDLTKRNKVVS